MPHYSEELADFYSHIRVFLNFDRGTLNDGTDSLVHLVKL